MEPANEPLTAEQVEMVCRSAHDWLRINKENNQKEITPADALHSALLRRLLQGKPPLPKPPPLSFSYPNYDLGEGEAVEVTEIWEPPLPATDGYPLVIDQSRAWRWHNQELGLLQHRNGDMFRLRKEARHRASLLADGTRSTVTYQANILQKIS